MGEIFKSNRLWMYACVAERIRLNSLSVFAALIEDDDDLLPKRAYKKRKKVPIVTFVQWIENLTTDMQFKRHTRFTRNQFENLHHILMQDKAYARYRDAEPRIKLAMTLVFFVSGSLMKIESEFKTNTDFNIRIIKQVCHAIYAGLYDYYIGNIPKILTDKDYIKELADKYYKKTEAKHDTCLANIFEGAIGAIDGFVCRIRRPSDKYLRENGLTTADFHNSRKNSYGLNVQAVCDADAKFIQFTVTTPASHDDAFVWRRSNIGQELQKSDALWDIDSQRYFLIGDAAYRGLKSILVPYVKPRGGFLNPDQSNYNFFQSSIRMVVERAFGILANRFKVLSHYGFLPFTSADVNAQVITAILLLHNFLLDEGDLPDFMYDNSEDEIDTCVATGDDQENNTTYSVRIEREARPNEETMYEVQESIRCKINSEGYVRP